jgi:hypothetical protein
MEPTDDEDRSANTTRIGYDHGFSPAVGRGSEEVRRAGDLAFRPPPPGAQWPGREVSEEELEGVPSTSTDARPPLGVGVSVSGRPEEMATRRKEKGRRWLGLRGRSRRPAGVSTPEEATGVAPQEPVHKESPYLRPRG